VIAATSTSSTIDAIGLLAHQRAGRVGAVGREDPRHDLRLTVAQLVKEVAQCALAWLAALATVVAGRHQRHMDCCRLGHGAYYVRVRLLPILPIVVEMEIHCYQL
jgi:hypothetical protein